MAPASGYARLRLRRGVDFKAVHATRQARRGELISVHWGPNQLGHPRIGITVSARVGGSVQRNLVRRRLRDVVRPALAGSDRSVDIVVVARPAAATAAFAQLQAEFERLAALVLGL